MQISVCCDVRLHGYRAIASHRSTRYKPSWSCLMHKGPWLTSWLIDPLDRTWTRRRRTFSTDNSNLLKFDWTFETKRWVVACHSVADDTDDGVSARSVRRKCEHRAGDRTRPVTTVTKNHSGQKSASAPVPKTVCRTHAREQEEHNKLFGLSVVMAIKIPLGGVVLKIKYPDSYTNLCQILIGLSLNVLSLEVVSQKWE